MTVMSILHIMLPALLHVPPRFEAKGYLLHLYIIYDQFIFETNIAIGRDKIKGC